VGLDVELVRVVQEGTSSRRRRTTAVAMVIDADDRFANAVVRVQRGGSTPMLDRVDIYSDLELSRGEMAQFLGELDQMADAAGGAAERAALQDVRRLAERCADEQDLALRLLGD
jgi:hypothetical protein